MERINLVYIDDQIDPLLSKHLSEYQPDGIEIHYDEVKFDCENGYESLIKDNLVKSANIIFIDSRLFENSTASSGKYTGEQFKLILKKYYPFIEVIVITQNEIPEQYSSTIAKYNLAIEGTSDEYYNNLFQKNIDSAIARICEYRAILSDIKIDSEISCTVEKINNSLEGIDRYDELNKTDIDKIVELFKKLQENLDG